jgi:hypothetical protein
VSRLRDTSGADARGGACPYCGQQLITPESEQAINEMLQGLEDDINALLAERNTLSEEQPGGRVGVERRRERRDRHRAGTAPCRSTR